MSADWVKQAGLSAPTSFAFITRFLGPGATLNRYDVPERADLPMAAVDVMTTVNRAALDDYRRRLVPDQSTAGLHKSRRTLQFDAAQKKVIFTNADTATDGPDRTGTPATWTWRSATPASASPSSSARRSAATTAAPAGTAVLGHSALRPAMWVTRHSPIPWAGRSTRHPARRPRLSPSPRHGNGGTQPTRASA